MVDRGGVIGPLQVTLMSTEAFGSIGLIRGLEALQIAMVTQRSKSMEHFRQTSDQWSFKEVMDFIRATKIKGWLLAPVGAVVTAGYTVVGKPMDLIAVPTSSTSTIKDFPAGGWHKGDVFLTHVSGERRRVHISVLHKAVL